jgi:LysM repeat protein
LLLELPGLRSYCRRMKRISFFLLAALLAAPVISPAQDAATEERLNKLSAQIDVLIEAKDAQNKKIEGLEKQISELQGQLSKPNGSYATTDDLKQLADKLKEVDKNRVADNELIVKKLEALGTTLAGGSGRKPPVASDVKPTPPVNPSDPHYEYMVQPNDTLGAIAKAYREKNIKVTVQQILNANPGLKPENMKVGQKLIIPKPAQ